MGRDSRVQVLLVVNLEEDGKQKNRHFGGLCVLEMISKTGA
jgi:hypothetical protein